MDNYENHTSFSVSKSPYCWLASLAFFVGVYSIEDYSSSLLVMARHKNIPVKSYYHRAKVFGYLALMIIVWLLVMYLLDKFVK